MTFGRCGCFSIQSWSFNTSLRSSSGNFLYCSSQEAICRLIVTIRFFIYFLSKKTLRKALIKTSRTLVDFGLKSNHNLVINSLQTSLRQLKNKPSDQLNSHLLNERLLLLVAVMIDAISRVFHCFAHEEEIKFLKKGTHRRVGEWGTQTNDFKWKANMQKRVEETTKQAYAQHMDQTNCDAVVPVICHFVEFPYRSDWSLHMTRDAYAL